MADSAAGARPDLLDVERLRVRFRTMGAIRARLAGVADPFLDAVLDVSFTLKAGTTFALVGESGSGKTTLGRAILGLVPVHSGTVRFDGKAVQGTSDSAFQPLRRRIAMMFQDPVASLSPRLTVKSLITEPFLIHGLRDRNLDQEAKRLLDMVGLPAGFVARYPHELSGGQARRVGVARALALTPKLIIADEPTAGLDVSVQGEILNLMNRLQQELGLAYLIITHNLAVARHVTDRIAILYLGRVVEEGPTEAVFAAPAHPYTLALLSAETATNGERIAIEGEVPSLWARPRGCEFHPRCPFAQDLCRARAPEPRPVAADHMVRCHFPHGVGRAA